MTRNNFLKRLGLMAITAVVAPFVPKKLDEKAICQKEHAVRLNLQQHKGFGYDGTSAHFKMWEEAAPATEIFSSGTTSSYPSLKRSATGLYRLSKPKT